MKDIVTNKRKISTDAITAMLVGFSFKGKVPEKRVDPGIPTIPCQIKETYVRYALWCTPFLYPCYDQACL